MMLIGTTTTLSTNISDCEQSLVKFHLSSPATVDGTLPTPEEKHEKSTSSASEGYSDRDHPFLLKLQAELSG